MSKIAKNKTKPRLENRVVDDQAVEHGQLLKQWRTARGFSNKKAFVDLVVKQGVDLSYSYWVKIESGERPLASVDESVRYMFRRIVGVSVEEWERKTGIVAHEGDVTTGTRDNVLIQPGTLLHLGRRESALEALALPEHRLGGSKPEDLEYYVVEPDTLVSDEARAYLPLYAKVIVNVARNPKPDDYVLVRQGRVYGFRYCEGSSHTLERHDRQFDVKVEVGGKHPDKIMGTVVTYEPETHIERHRRKTVQQK